MEQHNQYLRQKTDAKLNSTLKMEINQ